MVLRKNWWMWQDDTTIAFVNDSLLCDLDYGHLASFFYNNRVPFPWHMPEECPFWHRFNLPSIYTKCKGKTVHKIQSALYCTTTFQYTRPNIKTCLPHLSMRCVWYCSSALFKWLPMSWHMALCLEERRPCFLISYKPFRMNVYKNLSSDMS